IGNARNCKAIIKPKLSNKNRYLNLLGAQARELNFIENNLISETSKKLDKATMPSKINSCLICGYCSAINGREIITKVFIGVLTPIKSVVCRVSILNFARRKAEKTVITKPKYGK